MKYYHIGFGKEDLSDNPPKLALLSAEPERSNRIAQKYLRDARLLSAYRGLNSYIGNLPNGLPVLAATCGMGAPSASVVVNELIGVGINKIIRIGTCGAIQPRISVGSIVISQAALCRQGAANDIAPPEYPAVADPFLTVALVRAARELNVEYHLGISASVDTFYEGQERQKTSANPYLLRSLSGITEEYRRLNILNSEMEAGTLFKMAGVYGFARACVCAVISQRNEAEDIVSELKEAAIEKAIEVTIKTAQNID